MDQLAATHAMQMNNIIERNPETKFVLFHCSYLWVDDIAGLFHVYENVYPDLCWLPLLSTSVAERVLHELIEVGTIDKISGDVTPGLQKKVTGLCCPLSMYWQRF